MFLFIYNRFFLFSTRKTVSIHPMFLFINFFLRNITALPLFQYIPCSYLSSHLSNTFLAKFQFQYIPCSYLSIFSLLSANIVKRFNTSHVPIYLAFQLSYITPLSFQYIPCSYLSFACLLAIVYALQFQYIPCSYLSICVRNIFLCYLMFQYIPCSYLSLICNSTSDNLYIVSIHPMFLFIDSSFRFHILHSFVSIHPMFLFIISYLRFLPFLPMVSIHPMFLFIINGFIILSGGDAFQYIPCSYLSLACPYNHVFKLKVSIHPMFLFIIGYDYTIG